MWKVIKGIRALAQEHRRISDRKIIKQRHQSPTIESLPQEVLALIFSYVVCDGKFNPNLPMVCSEWTKIMYRFIYMCGFYMHDGCYKSIIESLKILVENIDNSPFSDIIHRFHTEGLVSRYALSFHQCVYSFHLMYFESPFVKAATAIARCYTELRFGRSYKQILPFEKVCVIL